MKKYPDIGEIIIKKEKQRRSLAALPFEKKIEMVFRRRERQKFIKSGRVVSTSQKLTIPPRASKQVTEVCGKASKNLRTFLRS